MKSISSSFFGRFFGNATKVIINQCGLTVYVQHSVTEITWQQLLSPPTFHAHWLGNTLVFSSKKSRYVLTKLAYNSDKQLRFMQQQWIKTHQKRLQHLLDNIDNGIIQRYLRQSNLHHMQVAVNTEYQRWFPWAQLNQNVEISAMLERLATYQHWQQTDINTCRENYINKQLLRYHDFFATIESNPLTLKQRRACIIDDDNNLLLAGAGTGKTSVMVGRAGYLLNSQQATHNELLLLAYGKQAADEMDKRINEKLATDKITTATFHSLGLAIITQVEDKKPTISRFAQDEKAKAHWVEDCFERLIKDNAQYRTCVLAYFSQHYYVEKSAFDFESLGGYYQYLQDNDIRSLKGDRVTSFGELYIANWLFNHGIDYQYKKNYHIKVHKQYQPDFFLPAFNLYIEYADIDEKGNSAAYVDNELYHQSLHWKRQLHVDNHSQCIELTFAMHQKEALLEVLRQSLTEYGVEFSLLADELQLDNLRKTGRITALAGVFSQLIGLYKAAGLDERAVKARIVDGAGSIQAQQTLYLVMPIYNAYQSLLTQHHEIDFEDMLINALHYVETRQFIPTWRYIMVDEFQDISEPRARLIKALRDNNKGCSVFAVGDDWQAIYRFSGADVSLTTGFSDYFGRATQTELDKTFRFNNKIAQVASDFMTKNPTQIKKTVHSVTQVKKPAVSILRRATEKSANKKQIDEINNGALADILTAINVQSKQRVTVYLLARFWFQLPDKSSVGQLNQQYPMLDIEIQSVHASKGKEADYVILLGLISGKHGFPSQKVAPAILDVFLAEQETFEHAEERRLFYVALTRAKQRVYILADTSDGNVFVQELIEQHDVELNEFSHVDNQSSVKKEACTICKTGTLQLRSGRYGDFYACSYFPRCHYKGSAC